MIHDDKFFKLYWNIAGNVLDELLKAKQKHPDNKWPWNSEDFNIFERVGLVTTEAGEAMQEANKIYFNHELHRKTRLKEELIQTASTAIRVLMSME